LPAIRPAAARCARIDAAILVSVCARVLLPLGGVVWCGTHEREAAAVFAVAGRPCVTGRGQVLWTGKRGGGFDKRSKREEERF